MKRLRRNFLLVIVLLLFVSVKSEAEDEIRSVHDEGAIKGCDNNSGEVTVKVQGTKSDESECPCVSSDGKNENSKLEKPDQVSNSDDKTQISKSQDTKGSQLVADSKQANENANECNQQSGSQPAKSEELKLEDSDNPPVAVDGSKPQKTKEDDKNQVSKTHLLFSCRYLWFIPLKLV